MTITRLEAKYKLSQNRSETDQTSVIHHLTQSAHPDDQATATFMMQYKAQET